MNRERDRERVNESNEKRLGDRDRHRQTDKRTDREKWGEERKVKEREGEWMRERERETGI